MLHKTTNKLFRGTYQYKVVLICAFAHHFRSGDLDTTAVRLQTTEVVAQSTRSSKYLDNYLYAVDVLAALKKLTDFEIRVESPWISVYLNNMDDVDMLIAIDQDRVKYVSLPIVPLTSGTIVMSKRDYDYRITLGKTRQNHESFVEWAEANSGKLKLTKSCKKDLLKDRSWGGSYFYITGENMVLMAKMHLGDSISKIERITKKIG